MYVVWAVVTFSCAAAAPRLLSCQQHAEWAAFHARLMQPASNQEAAATASRRPEGRQEDDLPTVCASLDLELAHQAGRAIERHMPTGDAVEAFAALFRRECDPETSSITECAAAASWEGRSPCLYGIVSASACLANMCLHDADGMAAAGFFLEHTVEGLHGILWGAQRLLEFLNDSSWPFSVEDVALIVAAARKPIAARRRPGRPWTRSSAATAATKALAEHTLAAVSSWRWPPAPGNSARWADASRPQGDATTRGRGAPWPLQLHLWAYGTHCSVLAEPVAVLAATLVQDFELKVTWRGTKDYCAFHAGSQHGPQRDEGSAVQEVTEVFLRKRGDEHAHEDVLRTPRDYGKAMAAALARDPALWAADAALCSEPAYACLVLHETGKPILGYFGVHVGFLLDAEEDQLELYHAFRDQLALNPRSTFATKAPYLSMQIYYHTAVKIPAVRPTSLYTAPAAYTGERKGEVLVNRRPGKGAGWIWDLPWILQSFADHAAGGNGGYGTTPLRFVSAAAVPGGWKEWTTFSAAVYFPYEWLQTMTLYDWVNMAIPTFVPDSPLYTYTQGTNNRDEWAETVWGGDPPATDFPHRYADWDDLDGRAYWWSLTDFAALPGIVAFASIGELLAGVALQSSLWAASQRLRQAHLHRLAQSAVFWRSAALRALDGCAVACAA